MSIPLLRCEREITYEGASFVSIICPMILNVPDLLLDCWCDRGSITGAVSGD